MERSSQKLFCDPIEKTGPEAAGQYFHVPWQFPPAIVLPCQWKYWHRANSHWLGSIIRPSPVLERPNECSYRRGLGMLPRLQVLLFCMAVSATAVIEGCLVRSWKQARIVIVSARRRSRDHYIVLAWTRLAPLLFSQRIAYPFPESPLPGAGGKGGVVGDVAASPTTPLRCARDVPHGRLATPAPFDASASSGRVVTWQWKFCLPLKVSDVFPQGTRCSGIDIYSQ